MRFTSRGRRSRSSATTGKRLTPVHRSTGSPITSRKIAFSGVGPAARRWVFWASPQRPRRTLPACTSPMMTPSKRPPENSRVRSASALSNC